MRKKPKDGYIRFFNDIDMLDTKNHGHTEARTNRTNTENFKLINLLNVAHLEGIIYNRLNTWSLINRFLQESA